MGFKKYYVWYKIIVFLGALVWGIFPAKNTYADGEGVVDVSPSSVRVADYTTLFIVYIAETELREGNWVAFIIQGNEKRGGWSIPQIEYPTKTGFTTVRVSDGCNAKVELSITHPLSSLSYSVKATVTNGSVKPGESIIIIYGEKSEGNPGAKVQNLAGTLHLDVVSDTDDDHSTSALVDHLPLEIYSDLPAKILLGIAPSQVVGEDPFDITVVALDMYGNPTSNYTGTVTLSGYDNFYYSGPYTFSTLDEGQHVFESCRILGDSTKDGIYRIKVNDNTNLGIGGHIKGLNPIWRLSKPLRYKRYFGDLHTHSKYSQDGPIRVLPSDIYEYAKDISRLDFVAISDHAEFGYGDFWRENGWDNLIETNDLYNESEKFVTLLGFEHSGRWGKLYERPELHKHGDGHRNVYYQANSLLLEPYPAPFPLYNGESLDLFKELKDQYLSEGIPALVFPHHSAEGRLYLDWYNPEDSSQLYHDQELQTCVEIYSSHGNSEKENCPDAVSDFKVESSVQEGLAVLFSAPERYTIGIIASSDSHIGRVGLNNWEEVEELWGKSYGSAYTVVLAKELSREKIWSAFYNRRCYATTGVRVLLDFSANLNGKRYPMGSVIYTSTSPTFKVIASGTTNIDKVEVIKYDVETGYKEIALANPDKPLDYVKTFIDNSFAKNGRDCFYYIRVTQVDGEMAWSSPIYLRYQ
jgi:hypothetical protein